MVAGTSKETESSKMITPTVYAEGTQFECVGKYNKRGKQVPFGVDDAGRAILGYKADGTPCCGRRIHDHKPPYCQSIHRAQNGRCDRHGGKAASGVLSGNFKNGNGLARQYGKYAQSVPRRMVDRLEAFYLNPQYLSVRDEMAVMALRFDELLKSLETSLDQNVWHDLSATVALADLALLDKNVDRYEDYLQQIVNITREGAAQQATWDDMARTAETVRKLSETEQKLVIAANQMIKAEDAYAVILAIQAAVREATMTVVPQEYHHKLLAAIQIRMDRIIQTTPSGRIDPLDLPAIPV